MARMSPDQRREAIVDAALAVVRTKGLAATTVRDVAAEMGCSSGLIHHYFGAMDDVIAAAFERVAGGDFEATSRAVALASGPTRELIAFLRAYAPVDADWAFQLWLDAWAEAARRPALQATSRRLNLAWHGLLERLIRRGVESGEFACADPTAAAWRILSVLDGLALQVVAHGSVISRADMQRWATSAAERELGLPPGALAEDGSVTGAG